MSQPPPAEQKLWRQVLPIVLALALVGWVLWRIDWDAFTRAMASVSYPTFVGFIALFLVCLLSADTLATMKIMQKNIAGTTVKSGRTPRARSQIPRTIAAPRAQDMIRAPRPDSAK